MTRTTRSIASMLAICLLMTPLTGCSGGLVTLLQLVAGSKSVTVVKVECPPLDPPNGEAVAALRADAKVHPATGKWAVKLEKHLEKLDACPPAKP